MLFLGTIVIKKILKNNFSLKYSFATKAPGLLCYYSQKYCFFNKII